MSGTTPPVTKSTQKSTHSISGNRSHMRRSNRSNQQTTNTTINTSEIAPTVSQPVAENISYMRHSHRSNQSFINTINPIFYLLSSGSLLSICCIIFMVIIFSFMK